MKKIALFVCGFLISHAGFSISYYLATNGNDANSGTSSSTPWQSLDKLNTTSFQPGDSVLFRCGDIFRGQINLYQGGNQFKRVVFTSYGTGNKPVISGSVLNSSWIASGPMYSTTISDSVASFYVNGHAEELARYPNEHQYLTLDSAQTTYLKDQSLSSLDPNLLKGNICIHTSQWSWEKSQINGVSGNKIIFQTPVLQKSIPNFAYFLYNDLIHLDTISEWFYDKSSSTLYYHPETGVDPNSLLTESSVYENGILLMSNVAYVSIINLAFENQYNAGVTMVGSGNNHILIDGCDFSGQYNHGVNDKGRYNEISNSVFREIEGIAVFVDGAGFQSTIHHNTFRAIGLVRNSGIGAEINSSAIMAAFIDSCYIHHNNIDTTGYCGISVDGAYNLIERNIVKHAMRLNNDGGGIKSYGAQSHHNIIRNNFVSESEGNKEGTSNANFVTPAIYFDFNVNNCLIESNTVYNHTQKGIFQNSGVNNNTITKNIIYQSDYGLDLNGNPLMPTAISGMHITKNVFFARNDQSYALRQVDYTGAFNTGVIDSNYYFQPYNSEHYVLRMNGTTPTDYSFTEWQVTGFDLNSVPSAYSWANGTNDSELFMNPGDDPAVVDLSGMKYLDLDGNEICGTFTLDPYTSRVLLTTGIVCTSSIAENEHENDFLPYPNPSNGFVYFITTESVFTVQVSDATGRLVLEQNEESGKQIDLSQNPKGVYHLRVSNGQRIYYYKLIKE